MLEIDIYIVSIYCDGLQAPPRKEKNLLFVLNHLRNHRPHHPNITVQYPTQGPEYSCRGKRAGEPEAQTRYARPQQADYKHPFPPDTVCIRQPTPKDRRKELCSRETGLQHTRLGRNCRIGKRLIEGFELVEHVRLQGRLRQGFGQTRKGQDGELTFLWQRRPGCRFFVRGVAIIVDSLGTVSVIGIVARRLRNRWKKLNTSGIIALTVVVGHRVVFSWLAVEQRPRGSICMVDMPIARK